MCKATHTSNINVSMSGKTLYLKQSKFVTAMPYHKPSSPNKNELYNNVIDLIREFKLERAGSGFWNIRLAQHIVTIHIDIMKLRSDLLQIRFII